MLNFIAEQCTGRFQGVNFHFGVVGGSHQQVALGYAVAQDTDSQERPRRGVSTAPSSSSRPSVPARPAPKWPLMRFIWPEKVDRSVRCSARRRCLPGPPLKARQRCLACWNQEAVLRQVRGADLPFSVTVLPPVLGAGDDQRVVACRPGQYPPATTFFLSMSGWRALFSLKWMVSLTAGMKAPAQWPDGLGQQQIDLQHGIIAKRTAAPASQPAPRKRTGCGDLLPVLAHAAA